MLAVSVIIPAYNASRYLEECLDSFGKQTLKNMEAIVIDDGSTDNTWDICCQKSIEFPHIKCHHIKHSGVACAQETGLRFAEGEYIGFCGSDDYVAPQMYEKLYYEAKLRDADIVECQCCRFWSNGKKIKNDSQKYIYRLKRNNYNLKHSGAEEIITSIGYAWRIHKRSMIDKYNLNFSSKASNAEDYPWNICAPCLAKHFSVIDYCGYYYRQHEEKNHSLSRMYFNNSDNFIKVFNQTDMIMQQSGYRDRIPFITLNEIRVIFFTISFRVLEENQVNFMQSVSKRWQKKKLTLYIFSFFWYFIRSHNFHKIDIVSLIINIKYILWAKNIATFGYSTVRHRKTQEQISFWMSGNVLKKILKKNNI
ncbi:glycosyltransferase [uncultured Victivallis sp.]|uniref:glycosyltransferase family 2 protein n=1 Tax=uncultured Victivallis sp. TaxID=354118 RepID=UPI0025D0F6FF|nr:glycosyltransferase [uncultured Victivallis sp.]